MPTPNSTLTPYCTPAQFISFYDVRWIGDRLEDLGARVTATSVLTDPNVLAILLAASGRIESKATEGNKYQPGDLAALSGGSQALLQQMTADIAAWLLWKRRPGRSPMPDGCKDALALLDDLADGTAVFGLVQQQTTQEQVQVWGPFGQQVPLFTPITSFMRRYLGLTTPGGLYNNYPYGWGG